MKRVDRTRMTVIAALALLAGGALLRRNPERSRLTDAERRGAGGRFVTLREGTVHYQMAEPAAGRRTGRGLVVLVHGFALPYHVWDSTVAGLNAAGYATLRYDLFGRGYSDRPDASYDADFYVRQLGELLDSLRVHEPIDLVGVSTGGWIAASFVARHPDRVRSLALISAITDRPTTPLVSRLPIIGALWFQSAGFRCISRRQAENFLHPARFREFTADFASEARFRGFGRSLRRTAAELARANLDSTYAEVDRVGGPVLIVWGRQDSTTPFIMSRRLRYAIPRAELVVVDSAGHLPQLERAAVVNERLIAFLDRAAGRTR